MTELATNVLYYGDNLDILRCFSPDACVDLIYLDPPPVQPFVASRRNDARP